VVECAFAHWRIVVVLPERGKMGTTAQTAPELIPISMKLKLKPLAWKGGHSIQICQGGDDRLRSHHYAVQFGARAMKGMI